MLVVPELHRNRHPQLPLLPLPKLKSCWKTLQCVSALALNQANSGGKKGNPKGEGGEKTKPTSKPDSNMDDASDTDGSKSDSDEDAAEQTITTQDGQTVSWLNPPF